MKNRFPSIIRPLFAVCVFFLTVASFSQNFPLLYNEGSISPEGPIGSGKLRFLLWAELDAYPGLSKEKLEQERSLSGATVWRNPKNAIFDYPISRIKIVAPFMVNALVCGYHFVYTPSDKARRVAEYFEVEPLGDFRGQIAYKEPTIKDDLLCAWVEYEKLPDERMRNRAWNSVLTQKISGHGKGKVSNGFDGITDSVKDALKDAVRTHYRKVVKNKPKEISGDVIVKNIPQFGIKSGYYIISLDFFLDNDIIVSYNQ